MPRDVTNEPLGGLDKDDCDYEDEAEAVPPQASDDGIDPLFADVNTHCERSP